MLNSSSNKIVEKICREMSLFEGAFEGAGCNGLETVEEVCWEMLFFRG